MEPEILAVDPGETRDICLGTEQVTECVKSVESEQTEVENTGQCVDEEAVDNNALEIQPRTAVVVKEPFEPDVTRFSFDVQHGYRIFRELLGDQYKSVAYPFIEPVDVEGLGLWDYYTRIETPMSFKQIECKFKSYLYQSITEVVSDMRLILENCYRYNGSNHWISKLAQRLENVLDQKLALLNRSLRDKVTLQATMAFRNNKQLVTEPEETGGRRRRSGRSTYLNGMTADQSSRLVSHLIMEEEETQKELRRLKEREKKEANEALMQELSEWEKEIFTPDVLKQLQSMWEIPSIGSFLWLFREALNLPELNYTEFENGFFMPHKSSQMARIFSALLSSPHQRKSLHKKAPMKFSMWQKKLKDRMDLWYMTKEAEEFRLVAHQIGLDHAFFEIMGKSNPLEKKSYLDLSLHQRVLILKALCDECLDCEPHLRDYLGTAETRPFREVFLGHDETNCSYVYFPVFDATDIRIYKQSPLPSIQDWYRTWTARSTTISGQLKSARSQSRSRKSESKRSSSKTKDQSISIEEGFELVCFDVETLRVLCEKFADHTTTPSGKRRRGRPSKKRSEQELHEVLVALVEELGKAESKYTKARVKGMVNLMKDWKALEEEPAGSEDESIVQNEVNDTNADNNFGVDYQMLETRAPNVTATTANSYELTEGKRGRESTSFSVTQQETAERRLVDDNTSSMLTRGRKRKRTFQDYKNPSPISSEFKVKMNSNSESSTAVSERREIINDNGSKYSDNNPSPKSIMTDDRDKMASLNFGETPSEFYAAMTDISKNSDQVLEIPAEKENFVFKSGANESDGETRNPVESDVVCRGTSGSRESGGNVCIESVERKSDEVRLAYEVTAKDSRVVRESSNEISVPAKSCILDNTGTLNSEAKLGCVSTSEDSGGNKKSCCKEDIECIGDVKEKDRLKGMNKLDNEGLHSLEWTNGDIDGKVGNVLREDGPSHMRIGHENVYEDQQDGDGNCPNIPGNAINIADNLDTGSSIGYENGYCGKKETACNGELIVDDCETPNKRCRTVDNLKDLTSPVGVHELTTESENSLETSHHSPAKTTLIVDARDHFIATENGPFD